MNVVYASEDNYAVHAGVSICSLCENNRDADEINIYVLSTYLNEENKEKLSAIADGYGRKLLFIEVGDMLSEFGKRIDAGSYGINVFGRFFMGTVLPETIDRLLYIDCDTVVPGNLGELFSERYFPEGSRAGGAEKADRDTGKAAAEPQQGPMMYAALEPTIYRSVKESIGFAEDEPYFNSGVLLIDFRRWRRERISEQLTEFYAAHGKQLVCGDQDTLNAVLRGRIGVLSPKYNFFTNYRYFRYETLAKRSEIFRKQVSRKAFEAAKSAPSVIHYLGAERPWFRGNLNPYRGVYERYLKKTPYRGRKKTAGKELYLFLFHVLELLTYLCPPVRAAVSGRYERKYIAPRTGGRERK